MTKSRLPTIDRIEEAVEKTEEVEMQIKRGANGTLEFQAGAKGLGPTVEKMRKTYEAPKGHLENPYLLKNKIKK